MCFVVCSLLSIRKAFNISSDPGGFKVVLGEFVLGIRLRHSEHIDLKVSYITSTGVSDE